MSGSRTFTLPLSTLLTPREVELMDYGIMGPHFRHRVMHLADGALMLFADEVVRSWGEERITELRTIATRRRTGCAGCGAPGRHRFTRINEMVCAKCYQEFEDEMEAFNELQAGIERLLRRHIRRWKGDRPVRDVIGNDGGWVDDILSHVTHQMLEEDLYGKPNRRLNIPLDNAAD